MTEPRSAVDLLADALVTCARGMNAWQHITPDEVRAVVTSALESLHHDTQPYLIIDTTRDHAWWAPAALALRGIHADRQPFGPARQTLRDWLALHVLDAADVVAFGFPGGGRIRVETLIRGAHGKILGSGGGFCTRVRDVPRVQLFPSELIPWLHALMMRDPDPDQEATT